MMPCRSLSRLNYSQIYPWQYGEVLPLLPETFAGLAKEQLLTLDLVVQQIWNSSNARGNRLCRKVAAKPTRTFPFGLVAVAVLIAAVGVGASFLQKPQDVATSHVLSAQPTAVVNAMFHCEGKTHCSQMSSCQEAKFYLNHCPGAKMDGDRDEVPCESQWCRF